MHVFYVCTYMDMDVCVQLEKKKIWLCIYMCHFSSAAKIQVSLWETSC